MELVFIQHCFITKVPMALNGNRKAHLKHILQVGGSHFEKYNYSATEVTWWDFFNKM